MSFLPTAAYEVFGQMDGVSVRGRVRIRALVFEQHFSYNSVDMCNGAFAIAA